MNKTLISAACGAILAACSPTPTTLSGDPAQYLATIDQLPQAGFYVQDAAHPLSVSEAARGVASAIAVRNQQHMGAAADERFFRDVGQLALSNGPVDIITQAERYPSPADAQSVLTSDAVGRDKLSGYSTLSTGPLGESAHCDQFTASAPDGTKLVEYIVEWRIQNVLNTLFARGREGATRVEDALLIAQRQTANEGGATPTPSASA